MYHCVDTLIQGGRYDEPKGLGQAGYLLADVDLPPDPALLDAASEYVSRTWRARRYGLIGGLVLGVTLPAAADQAVLALPLIPAGYLLGVLLSELLAPRPSLSRIRQAALQRRRARDLVPTWARIAYWVLLVPVLAAPLLALVHRAQGATRIVTADYTCSAASSSWPAGRTFVLAGLLGAVGLGLTELTLAALTRRPRPAGNPAMSRLDYLLRQLSAQSVVAGAAALGLTMIATICDAISQAWPRCCVSQSACQRPWTLCLPVGRVDRAVDRLGRPRERRRHAADRGDIGVAYFAAPCPVPWRSRMMLSVDTESAVPPFEQIRAQISQLAASGELPAGTRLPSIRQLSADLGLAPGTVGRAYRELETAGVISARGRHGSFISGRPATRKTAPAEAARSNPLRQAAADYARTAAQLGATASETVQTLAQLLAES